MHRSISWGPELAFSTRISPAAVKTDLRVKKKNIKKQVFIKLLINEVRAEGEGERERGEQTGVGVRLKVKAR